MCFRDNGAVITINSTIFSELCLYIKIRLSGKQPYLIKLLIKKSALFCNSLSLRNAIYGADGSAEMTAYAL